MLPGVRRTRCPDRSAASNLVGPRDWGAEFANLIHHAYPGDDYSNLMAATDAAIATGSVDPGQLVVTGGSGGGVLTAWIVGKTDRYRAAATQKPVIDWASFVLTADNTPFLARYCFGAYPWEEPENTGRSPRRANGARQGAGRQPCRAGGAAVAVGG